MLYIIQVFLFPDDKPTEKAWYISAITGSS